MILADSQHISSFVSHILQFEIHKVLCQEAGQYMPGDDSSKPLYECDIYRNAAAGNKLR